MKDRFIKSLIFLVCFVMLLGVIWIGALTVSADNPKSGTCGAFLYWNYDPTTYTLSISGSGDMRNYSKEYYDGISYITVPWAVYGYNETLKTVIIEAGATSIGSYAFYGCTGLTSITIPDGITSIGNQAFYNCTGLTSITIPDSVTSIGIQAFSGCTGLTSINIPDSVTSIDLAVFSWCTGLTSLIIPDSVTSIGGSAFSGCTGLTSITIPGSVTSIGSRAFDGCTGLVSITIPASVTSIGDRAFYGCTGLESIAVKTGNISYQSKGNCLIDTANKTLIKGCNNSVIPDDGSASSIEKYAFYGCTGLTSINIPDSVTSIGDCAFYDCTGLTSINIPDSVTTIGSGAFWGCTGLTSITIPDSVTSIGSSTFVHCEALQSVIIGNNVTSIGYQAFYGCKRLTSITIPDSVTNIGSYAFYGCIGLKDFQISDNVNSIGEKAFDNSSVIFYTGTASGSPWGAKAVYKDFEGDLAFSDPNNSNLVYCKKTATSITIPDSVTSIGASAFSGCINLATITLPDTITQIGANAFNNTAYYNNASNWSDNMLYIGNYLIKGKTDLAGNKSVKSGTTCIADSAFYGCNKIITLTVPTSVKYIGTNAFFNVTNVAYTCTATGSYWGARCMNGYTDGNFVYSDSGKAKLVACSGLATGSVVIPSSTDTIGNNAFSACSTITNVYIPVNVTRIGNSAFQNTSLSDVYYEGSTIDKLGISFGDNNAKVNNATWHYNSKVSDMPQATVYTLSYNANGGSGAPGNQTGSGYVTISNTKPTRSGYTFLGWATTSNALSAQYNAGSLINLDKDITLYAVWQKNTTPDNPDNPNPPTPDIPEANVIKGNSADNKKTYNYRTTVTFTANVPEGGSVQWYVDGSPAGNGSTLTVKDKTNDYTVKVVVTDKNGNQTMDEEHVTIKHGFFDILIWFFVHLFNPGAYDVKQ